MKIQIVSDIHLDHMNDLDDLDFEKIIKPSAEYLAIAGDIGFTDFPETDIAFNLLRFMKFCSTSFARVFIVLGNHDYYNGSGTDMDTQRDLIKSALAAYSNVHVLERARFDIDSDHVILGATLWSNISDYHTAYMIHDFNYIYGKTHQKINMNDTNEIHEKTVEWLDKSIKEIRAENENAHIIVLTHHVPSYQLLSPDYAGLDCTDAYASNLEYLMHRVNYWICGHSHFSITQIINGCVCVSNPKGYPGENDTEYSEGKTIGG